MRPKESALKMNVMMTVELPGGVPSITPDSPAGEVVVCQEGRQHRIPTLRRVRAGFRGCFWHTCTGSAHACVYTCANRCVCEQGDP